jgi:predicted RNase H-like nuclease (RuvC/YqgF family)
MNTEIENELLTSNLNAAIRIKHLKAELEQQKFNNKHNLSIDQEVSDEIVRLKAELELSQRNVKILTDALNFYSSVRNWELASDPQGNQAKCIIDPVDHEELEDNWGDVEWVGGKRARAALEICGFSAKDDPVISDLFSIRGEFK